MLSIPFSLNLDVLSEAKCEISIRETHEKVNKVLESYRTKEEMKGYNGEHDDTVRIYNEEEKAKSDERLRKYAEKN